MKCKIRITKELNGIFPKYQPRVGRIYNAEYRESKNTSHTCPPICIIDISGKNIIVRHDEFEVVE